MRLIPAIDLRGGHCVRLLRGDFAAETRYEAEPLELLARYRRDGADWLHVVDLDGARDGSGGNRPLIATLAAQSGIQLQVGGGLRDFAAVQDVLDLGAGRAVVGSAALTEPHEVRHWIRHFGSGRIALAFDVRLDDAGTPCIATHGWLRQSTLPLRRAVAEYLDAGLIHVLCTDVSRDGALSGPNVELYAQAVRYHPGVAWQASGGIRDAGDLHALAECGAAAAISGKALLEQRIPIEELRPFLPNA
jgi:phosphoribosylformimino-5-aminoimidazole carboxamide ribotide isomerase